MLSQPSLRDAENPREFIARIAAAAKALPKGQWLEGGNWDQDRWGGEMPNRSWIDPVTPDTPVAVIRYDLHMPLLRSAERRVGKEWVSSCGYRWSLAYSKKNKHIMTT